MPVSYAGTVTEHIATRRAVGLFDVSHLGKASVRGPRAAAFVNSALSNDLRRIHPGKAQYTLCCNESGGVVDDLIVYYVSDEEMFLVPNAANTAAVVEALRAAAPPEISVANEHRSYAVLAVQGPRSADVLTRLGLPTDMDYMGYADAEFDGVAVRVCRTGYTGEHGYELLPPWESASVVFDALLGVETGQVVEGAAIPGVAVEQGIRAEELDQVATHAQQIGPAALLLEPLGHRPQVVQLGVEALEGRRAQNVALVTAVGRQVHVELGVTLPGPVGLTRLGEAVGGELAQGLQQPVTIGNRVEDDQGAVDQVKDGVDHIQ